ncbi:MAG TPA: SRPBCC family protein [Acidothermaceae bacterium]|nr:SRPBCC family protein [Acidothermaceae bacterium]
MAEVVARVDVAAPPKAVWDKLVDWPTHRQWMVLTKVESTTEDREGVGAGIVGVTGIGPVAFQDPMTVTAWQPPPAPVARCEVAHMGRIVRGAGAFEVEETPTGSRVVWSEWVRLPFGLLGDVGWLAVKPVAAVFLRISLRRLAKLVEATDR